MNQYPYDGKCILIRKMREILIEVGYQEVCLAGKVARGNGEDLSLLFPVGVYGFSVELVEEERDELFKEAEEKGLSKLENIDRFLPICGTRPRQYPLYWGQDRYIAHRLSAHLARCDSYKGTGSIRLNMYKSLRGKQIYCAVIIVKDKNTATEIEGLLQNKYPNLLKTKT